MNKYILIVLTVLLTLSIAGIHFAQEEIECPSFADSPTSERITYYMGEGAGFLAGRQYDRAIRSYTCVLQLDDDYIGAYNQRAVAYTMRQNYEFAINDYDRALEIDSRSRAVLNNRGIAYAAIFDYERAIADFNAVIELDQDYVSGYLNRGVIKAVQGEFEEAILDMEEAIAVSGIDQTLTELRDPDRPSDAPRIAYDRNHARMYAILGVIYSGFALDNYRDYLFLGGGDQRIQNAAGSLESRFNFDLRLDDGTWLLRASFDVAGMEVIE